MRHPIALVLPRLDGITPLHDGSWMCRCPAHDDRRASLHVTEKPDGRVIFYCHAGCGGAAVVEALGLRFSDLRPDDCENAAPEPVERNARESLRAVAHAVLVSAGLLNAVAARKVVTEKQAGLAARLAAEIQSALDAAGVKPEVASERRARS